MPRPRTPRPPESFAADLSTHAAALATLAGLVELAATGRLTGRATAALLATVRAVVTTYEKGLQARIEALEAELAALQKTKPLVNLTLTRD